MKKIIIHNVPDGFTLPEFSKAYAIDYVEAFRKIGTLFEFFKDMRIGVEDQKGKE